MPGGSSRLLIVEDDPVDARLVQELLASHGVGPEKIDHVGSIAAARKRLTELGEADEVPCVLLDLRLPDADGLEGLEQLDELDPRLPIVVLTGTDDEAMGLRALERGAQDFLVKRSINGELLSRAIQYAIERKRARTGDARASLLDPLTGLPTRALLAYRASVALMRARTRDSLLAVLHLDLGGDRPEAQAEGLDDMVILAVSKRLRSGLRPEDSIARLEGDSFGAVCEDVGTAEDAARLAAWLIEVLAYPIPLDDGPVTITPGVGVALSRGAEFDYEALFHAAAGAAREACSDGRPSHRVVAPLEA